jgi:xanthine dehydrogenase accessory factor
MTVVPIACQSEGALQVFVEPVQPAPHLVIVGSSPMTQTLADLARALGWRTALAPAGEFSADDVAERSMVVVATQGHGDEEAVEQAIAGRPAYLGLVASRRRGTAVLGYLADRGVPADRLDRVRVPAGLDLGRTSHREIAVAILAELVRLRAAGGLGEPTEEAAGQAEASEPGEAVDPVCGMTVRAEPASHPLAHRGVTYYFCRPACRRKFERDPAAYLEREPQC